MEDTDDGFEIERIRLRRLLEANILEAEKENLELINKMKSDELRKPNLADHGRATKEPTKLCSKSPASSSGWTPFSMKSGNLSPHSNMHYLNLMESLIKKRYGDKSKYVPCAIPLSPPIRIRREENESFLNSVQTSDLAKEKTQSNRKEPKERKKVLVVQKLPGLTICKEKNLKSVAVETEIKSDNAQKLSSTLTFPINTPVLAKPVEENSYSFPIAESLDENVTYPKCCHNASKKFDLSEPKTTLVEDKKENGGLNLNLILDSTSTKDIINRLLQKLPVVSGSDACSNKNADDFSSRKLANEGAERGPQLVTSSSNSFVQPERNYHQNIPLMKSVTQTENPMPSFFYQQLELQEFIRRIVKDSLESLNSDVLSSPKVLAVRKVDSGIQSEVEMDLAATGRDVPSLIDKVSFMGDNIHNSNASIGIQVQQSTCDKNINTSFKDIQENIAGGSLGSTVVPSIPSKVEITIEKIYDHLCNKVEINKAFVSPERPSLRTREVAVQFNPLQTLNKTTSTTEFKLVDSSTQHNMLYEPCTTAISDACVQVPDCPSLYKNEFTQCEATCFRENTAQTDAVTDQCPYHNSLSSSPTCDHMFIDDLISEGEIPLPWNLRLLSSSSGGVSTRDADSSDKSSKVQDYSLSEGEIPPCMLANFNSNRCDCYSSEQGNNSSDQHPGIKLQNSSIIRSETRPKTVETKPPSFHACLSPPSEGEINSTNFCSGGVPCASEVFESGWSGGNINYLLSCSEVLSDNNLSHTELFNAGSSNFLHQSSAKDTLVFKSPLAESSRINGSNSLSHAHHNDHF